MPLICLADCWPRRNRPRLHPEPPLRPSDYFRWVAPPAAVNGHRQSPRNLISPLTRTLGQNSPFPGKNLGWMIGKWSPPSLSCCPRRLAIRRSRFFRHTAGSLVPRETPSIGRQGFFIGFLLGRRFAHTATPASVSPFQVRVLGITRRSLFTMPAAPSNFAPNFFVDIDFAV